MEWKTTGILCELQIIQIKKEWLIKKERSSQEKRGVGPKGKKAGEQFIVACVLLNASQAGMTIMAPQTNALK